MSNGLKRQFRLAFERISDPLLLVDGSGFIVDFNPAARRVLDIGESERIEEVTSVEESFVFDAELVQSLLARSESVLGVRLRDNQGGSSDVVLDVIALDGRRSKASLKLLHIKDFSSFGRYERWKDELISMVAHEIKNPLSAMKNSMNIVLSQATGPVNDEQTRLLQTSIRGIDRLTRLLDGFLDMSRVSVGKYNFEPRWVNVRDFLPDVMDSFGTLFNVRRQTLRHTISNEVEQIFVDAPKLEQVLINLLSNAVKFTPSGGEITVSVEPASREAMRDDLRILDWSALANLDFIRIRVADTGIGMTGETASHLFTRYYEKGDGGDLRGSHLGLNISKTLTEVQYGSLEIESEPGVGTEVTVYLPEDETTTLTLSRLASMERCLARVAESCAEASFYVIQKDEQPSWPDVIESWATNPVVNPSLELEKGASTFCWTVGTKTAVLLSADRRGIEDLHAPDPRYAVARCRVPGDGHRLAPLLKLALNRIKTPDMVRA